VVALLLAGGSGVVAAVTAREILSLLIAALDLTLALVVIRHFAVRGRAGVWSLALIAFFVVRALDRASLGALSRELFLLGLLLDALVVVLVIVFIVGFDRMGGALKALLEQARHREAAYARALIDYRTLARHRLANPLTAILGSVQTLEQLPSLNGEIQRALLATIREQAQLLAGVALEPRPASEEERDLQPHPHVFSQ
jgi:signal transduction histidine kinase